MDTGNPLNNLKQVIQTEHKRIKNPTGRRQPWLLTSAAEDLNSGQPRTNPASRQSGSRTAALGSVVMNNYIIQQWYKSICRIINHNFQDKLKLLLAFFSLMFQSMKILPAPGMFTSNAINGFWRWWRNLAKASVVTQRFGLTVTRLKIRNATQSSLINTLNLSKKPTTSLQVLAKESSCKEIHQRVKVIIDVQNLI